MYNTTKRRSTGNFRYCVFGLDKKGDPAEHGIAQGYKISSAAETAQTAQQLPNGAAIRIVGAAIEKEHLANLLFQYLPREDKRIVTDS